MSNGVNSIHLVGHLGQDPEVRNTAGGKSVCTLSIATTRGETTSWHRCVVWGQTADFAGKYLSKGALVYVSGGLDYRKYTHKDGSERTSAEISVHTLQALGGKDRGSSGPTGPARDYAEPDGNKSPDDDGFDDIPF